mmetsp:Transcript_23679/g.54256  ORF Transcript_23679/g.54256 Transcript_23679/m.54256 type:complete len:94 (+) Transcript_23679:1086-1367(+)
MEYLTLFMASQKRRLAAGKRMASEKVPLMAHFMGMLFSGTRGLDPVAYGVAKNLYLANITLKSPPTWDEKRYITIWVTSLRIYGCSSTAARNC